MPSRLTISDKILVHLYHFRKYSERYDYPIEMTQQGIANSIGISITHVPRNVKKLQEEGLVSIKKGHVQGKKKRVTIYTLTPKGIIKAKDLIEKIGKMEIKIDDKYIKIEDLQRLTGKTLIEILRAIENGEKVEIKNERKIVFRELTVDNEFFIDRENELATMEKWYYQGKILSIVGPRGIGKTALVNEFTNRINIRHNIVWFHIYEGRTWSSIQDVIENLFEKRKILDVLRESPTLLIFDNYYMVDDEFVDALKSLTLENIGESKIIVTMPSSTPFYNRFYSIKDLSNGNVTELNLEAMKYEDARKFMPDVKEDAFKRIYQLTKGNTKILYLLAKGELNTNIGLPLTPETIHLLNYLASQKI
jgi:DNA-binding MarR family transcriptional regulator